MRPRCRTAFHASADSAPSQPAGGLRGGDGSAVIAQLAVLVPGYERPNRQAKAPPLQRLPLDSVDRLVGDNHRSDRQWAQRDSASEGGQREQAPTAPAEVAVVHVPSA